ncbi:hypothetical protein LAV60_15485 [Clostridium sporogenes]|uniref:hypothetical protein n=1 Tax=Clostridium sporogenes TaxID=1509 RepID=UPI0022377A76|nr:hypothetical protein [Clostridium sporogenes]MCW6094573.1 hypothetical protein [Clostridium sporogenes]
MFKQLSGRKIGHKGSATLYGMSKGERSVQRTLCKLRIKFYRESKFSDCRGGAENLPLPFDFSVYIGNELVALIEYQGVQHSVPTFGMKDWIKIQATDEIKRDYCKKRGIPLLEIPYHRFKDIDNIVTNFLRQKGILNKMKYIC